MVHECGGYLRDWKIPVLAVFLADRLNRAGGIMSEVAMNWPNACSSLPQQDLRYRYNNILAAPCDMQIL